MNKEIGIIISPSTVNEVKVYVTAPDSIQLEDIVVFCLNHEGESVHFYGIVQNLVSSSPEIEKDIDKMKAFYKNLAIYSQGVIADIKIIRVEPSVRKAPPLLTSVYLAEGCHLEKGLYFDSMRGRKVSAGILPNGVPAYIDYDFVNGEKGGHVSITGISGVAAKTSYQWFFLKSVMESKDICRETENSRAVVFNVKGEDCLFIDKVNSKLDDKSREDYKKLGIPAEPFDSVQFMAPGIKATSPEDLSIPDIHERDKKDVDVYRWGMRSFAKDGLLKFMFNDVNDNLSYVIDKVQESLSFYEFQSKRNKDGKLHVHEHIISSLEDISKIMEEEVEEENLKYDFIFFNARMHVATRMAFLRRFEKASMQLKNIVGDSLNVGDDRPLTFHKKVTVVDINSLSATAQNFVVSSIIDMVYKKKQDENNKNPFFICVDELNKYAPKGSWVPIKSTLNEIAERGRSLGVLLIGAQQMVSKVEDRVSSNSAIKVLGRLDAAEAQQADYSYLDSVLRKTVTTLPQGTMIMYQPSVPTPITIRFPFPAWATKLSEVDNSKEESIDFDKISNILEGGGMSL